jgi:single-strand DNA-binding protein
MNETLVTIVGTVISDVRKRNVQDGTPVAGFRMASNERRFDKANGQWVDGDHFYISVTCWRRLALGVLTSLEKGDPVVVRGRLYTRNYEVDAVKRSAVELEAYQVGPDLARCHVGVSRGRKPEAGAESPLGGEQVPVPRSAGEFTGPELGESRSEADADGRPVLSVVGGEST